MNLQIRRMCKYLGYSVTVLQRTRIITITLDLEVGKYKLLTLDEIQSLHKAIEPSCKTEEASFLGTKKQKMGKRNYDL